jgi:hypothetical protein
MVALLEIVGFWKIVTFLEIVAIWKIAGVPKMVTCREIVAVREIAVAQRMVAAVAAAVAEINQLVAIRFSQWSPSASARRAPWPLIGALGRNEPFAGCPWAVEVIPSFFHQRFPSSCDRQLDRRMSYGNCPSHRKEPEGIPSRIGLPIAEESAVGAVGLAQ